MHVLSKAKLRDFWNKHPRSRSPLENWFDFAGDAEWEDFNDVKLTFPHADRYGKFVIFDIGGNKYRLIVAIHYNRRKVYVRHVLTHAEYDIGKWKNE
ncbi:MAG TPA: type II toxin-antitoxin system HigB family toxin [Fimbriiglobus sp.]|jgi:mRNA interferase HigB